MILATQAPLLHHLCLSSALHLIPFPLYAVIARPGGDIGVRMDRHKGMRLFASPPPPSFLYLSISSNPLSLATTYTRSQIHALSLSLSAAVIIRLCPPCRHIRRVYDSVPLVPADACPPLLRTTPLQPCTVRSARSFAAFREKRETVYGRRVTRETWRNWQEGITDIGQRRIAMGYLLCPPTPPRIPASLAARIGRISHLDD